MDCELAGLVMSKWLDGEASAEEVVLLDEHCASCAACRDERAAQAGLHRVLGAALAGCLAALRPPRRQRAGWRGVAGAAAVVALMLGSAVAGYRLAPGRGEVRRGAPGAGAPSAALPARTAEPRVMVGEAEAEVARQVVWDAERGLRTASRIDRDRVYRVRAPSGFELEWRTTDSRYRLAGLGFED